MRQVIIIGGHGKVALLAESILTARGDTVAAIIRHPDQAGDVRAAGARPVVADVENLDVDGIADLLAGHDAIVWSAGAGGGDPARTYAVDRDAAIRSIDAAVQAGVRRYVMVSFFGSEVDHGLDAGHPLYNYAEAKAAADEHLRASGLDWTILGPSTLTSDPATGRIDVHADSAGTVSREDVAHVIAVVLADDSTIGRTIRFNGGEVPISDAVGSAPVG